MWSVGLATVTIPCSMLKRLILPSVFSHRLPAFVLPVCPSLLSVFCFQCISACFQTPVSSVSQSDSSLVFPVCPSLVLSSLYPALVTSCIPTSIFIFITSVALLAFWFVTCFSAAVSFSTSPIISTCALPACISHLSLCVFLCSTFLCTLLPFESSTLPAQSQRKAIYHVYLHL